MNNWFLLLPLWYFFWIFIVLMYAAYKQRPWKERLRSYSRRLGRHTLIVLALILLFTVVRMWLKDRPFSLDGWKLMLEEMLPVWCVSLSALVVADWEKSREEETAS